MIDVLFTLGPDTVLIRIDGSNLLFTNVSANSWLVPIENLKLSQKGVVKEFPDLDGDEEWKEKAIERFKNHVKKLETDEEKMDYVVKDLAKYGYVLKAYQKKGGRMVRV
jgi:hypothetical protein